MRLTLTQLKKLSVQTKSGAFLGKVKNIIFETEGQTVLQYEIGEVFGKKYLVSREQVISIDDEKIIVEDGIINVGASRDLPVIGKKMNVDPEGVTMRE